MPKYVLPKRKKENTKHGISPSYDYRRTVDLPANHELSSALTVGKDARIVLIGKVKRLAEGSQPLDSSITIDIDTIEAYPGRQSRAARHETQREYEKRRLSGGRLS